MSAQNAEPLFTDEDLTANQRGVITDRQVQRLRRQQKLFTYLIGFVGVSSITIAVVGVMVGNWIGTTFMVLMIVLAVVEFVVLYSLINRYRQQFQTDLAQGRVERYEGEAKTMSYRKRRGGLTAINIGEKQLYVDRANWRLLSAGGSYRVYVAPASSTLLSFERLD